MRRPRIRTILAHSTSLLAGLLAATVATAQATGADTAADRGAGTEAGARPSEAFSLKLDPKLGERAEFTGRCSAAATVVGRTGLNDARGRRQVRKAGTVIRGDRLTYYEADDELVAVGNVTHYATGQSSPYNCS
ncbi:MAG: hypothetical protein R3E41_08620 [Burkholderiaceae bacterium]